MGILSPEMGNKGGQNIDYWEWCKLMMNLTVIYFKTVKGMHEMGYLCPILSLCLIDLKNFLPSGLV